MPAIISNAHVAALYKSLPKSRYPKYAIIPSVTTMNITPIGALLPVNIPANAMTNMNTMLTPNRLPIGSIPNCLVESGLLNDLNVFSAGTPNGTLLSTCDVAGIVSSSSHMISFGSHITRDCLI